MTTRRVAVSAAASTLLIILGGVAPAAAETVEDRAASTLVTAPPPTSRSGPTDIDPAGYWTADKLASAIPMDETITGEEALALEGQIDRMLEAGGQGNASEPVAPTLAVEPANRANAPVPRTAGKLFYTRDGKNYVCSGSVINNHAKNLVVTAGHCVYATGKGWHSNIAFAPAYYDGKTPYGLWNWKEARAFNRWINDGEYSHDQAFVTFHPRSGSSLVSTVGGNGLSWGYGTAQVGVRVWGWPAGAPYTGKLPYYCDGNTSSKSLFSSDARIACDMTGGASGGPWLRERIDNNLGYVFAETSRRTTSGTPYLIATPNTQDVKAMFDLMS